MLKINCQSRKTLYRTFKCFFDNPPRSQEVWQILPPKFNKKNWTYGVDGKWLKRKGVFILHRNITDKVNLYWSYWKNETYTALHTDLQELTKILEKQKPKAAVSDWKGSIISAVNSHFGNIPHQRCLAHVVRQAKNLLPKKSPFSCTIQLRQIANDLIYLKNQQEIVGWFTKLDLWHERYNFMLKEKTIGEGTKKRWWYTHGNLRRGWRLLTKDTEPFFQHVSRQLLPHSNNSLEGTFSQAIGKLHDHRGMKINQQVSFLSWYFTFSRIKTKLQFKTLWDYWKSRK